MFTSTRGNLSISSSKAIYNGLADDGGLYVKKTINHLDYKKLIKLNYQEMAIIILKEFLDDYSNEEIQECVSKAYTNNFSNDDVVQLKRTNSCDYLELYHGPTLAFKDVALTVLPHLINLAKIKNKITTKTTILTATSGDTGSAALSGFSAIKDFKTYVFYPHNGVSTIQEQQMLSFSDNTSIAIEGNFDDCQRLVKDIFLKIPGLSSANSINIGRLIPQIVYYFYAYIKLINTNQIKADDLVNFCVPTGNFGDILAGYYASKMGLPINKLICASNQNNVLYDFFKTGKYDIKRKFHKTISPSMDILISSNMERLLFHITNDPKLVKEMINQLNTQGNYELKSIKELNIFSAYWSNDLEALQTIKDVFEKDNYLIDPHTAAAKAVYDKYILDTNDHTHTIILSTASPYKFAPSVGKALNLFEPNEFILIDKISQLTNTKIPISINKLKENLKKPFVMKKEEVMNYLKDVLK